MTRSPRRLFWAFAVVGLLVGGQALIVSGLTHSASDTSCTTLKRWAEDYRNTSPKLAWVASLDRSHRIALLNALSPETQAALWREHLGQFKQRPDLSDTQRTLIAAGIELTTPALYRQDAAANRALDDFWLRAKPAFTTRADALPWFDLGSVPEEVKVVSLWDRLTASFHAGASTDWCECTTQASEVWCPGSCAAGGCTFTTGCGLDGRSLCDGMCQ